MRIGISGLILILVQTISLAHATDAACAPTAAIPDIAFAPVARDLKEPVHIAAAPGEPERLYIVEQAGRIRIVEHGELLPQPFLDIRVRVDSGGEKGLLSIAFHPRYRENGYFFVNYTASNGGLHSVIARFTAKAGRALPDSEVVLLTIAQPYSNHNGGQLAFGPDGYLYIGMGDGGSANDPHGHGQNLNTLLGALLRIDANKSAAAQPYAIPPDNPFVRRKQARPEIYAYGLRNPWRFSFDSATGDLYLADVGQAHEEEIDIVRKGGNYGWNIMEGTICTPKVNPRCDRRGLALPIATYKHPEGFSVTGGFVYRGRAFPALCGVYLYADYVSKKIWGLRYDGKRVRAQRLIMETPYGISSFGVDNAGELYIADHAGGAVYKIVAPSARP